MEDLDVMSSSVVHDTVILTVMTIGSEEEPPRITYCRFWSEDKEDFVLEFIWGPDKFRESGVLEPYARKAFDEADKDARLCLQR